MHKLTVAAITALMLALVLAAAAAATPTETVELQARYAKQDKNKRHGSLSLRTTFKIADTDPAALQPVPLRHTTIRFPKGARVNAGDFGQCNLAALETKGECPKSAKIGSGTAKALARPIVTDEVSAVITLYNGKPEGRNPVILIYAVPDLGPNLALKAVLKSSGRSSNYGYVLDSDVPAIRTLPNAPDASVISFDATTSGTAKKRGRTIGFAQGPVVCDGTFFLLDGMFSYAGGISNTVYERFTLRGGPRCR